MIKTHACYDPKLPFPQDARIGEGKGIDDEEGTHIPPPGLVSFPVEVEEDYKGRYEVYAPAYLKLKPQEERDALDQAAAAKELKRHARGVAQQKILSLVDPTTGEPVGQTLEEAQLSWINLSMIKGIPGTPAELIATIEAQEAECQRLRQVYKLIKLDIEAGSMADTAAIDADPRWSTS